MNFILFHPQKGAQPPMVMLPFDCLVGIFALSAFSVPICHILRVCVCVCGAKFDSCYVLCGLLVQQCCQGPPFPPQRSRASMCCRKPPSAVCEHVFVWTLHLTRILTLGT